MPHCVKVHSLWKRANDLGTFYKDTGKVLMRNLPYGLVLSRITVVFAF